MPMSPGWPQHGAAAASSRRGNPRRLRLEETPPHQLDAQQGGTRGGKAPVATPRRTGHNQFGYGQNQDCEFSFPPPRNVFELAGGKDEETHIHAEDERLAAFREDRSAFGEWKPNIAIGSPLSLPGEDLSRIQLADRHIAQWRLILEYQDGAPHIRNILNKRIKERLALDEDDVENTQPLSSLDSARARAVRSRVKLLESSLGDTDNEMELANMKGAIAAYRSGEIPPGSAAYSIIYAGHVVDTAPTHMATLQNRTERLDRYYALHGPGALWFEPPLSTNRLVSTAKTSICLANEQRHRDESAGQGFYMVRMGFRPRETLLVRNDAGRLASKPHPLPAYRFPCAMTADPRAKVAPFDLMLDTGASFPTIFHGDLAAIGIDTRQYPAQARWTTIVADGREIKVSLFELDVFVLCPNNQPLRSFLDDAPRRIWPCEGDGLGETTFVNVLPGEAPSPDKGSQALQSRLSGMLPFLVCYVASVPGAFRLWLGEDRGDVLGADKMPGQQAYPCPVQDGPGGAAGPHPPPGPLNSGHPGWSDPPGGLPRPRIIFEHDLGGGRLLRDDDAGFGRSELALAPAVERVPHIQPNPGVVTLAVVEPRSLPWMKEWLRSWRQARAPGALPGAAKPERAREAAEKQRKLGLNRHGKRLRSSDGPAGQSEGMANNKHAADTEWWKIFGTMCAPPSNPRK